MQGFALCADDFALTAGVSRGVLRLLEAGRLSATGAMTNRPHWPANARELVAFVGRADLGVHLNLTCAHPLTEMPGFAPGRSFPTLGTVLRASLLGRLPLSEIAAEIDAQCAAFEDATGRMPDFIDGHQHVHGLPGIRDLVLMVASRRYPGVPKPWLRMSGDCLNRIAARRAFAGKALTVTALTAGFRSRAKALGFPVNNGFAGFSNFDPAADYAAQFARYLVAPGTRHLVMCHPGEVDDELAGLDPVVATRGQELAFFESAKCDEVMAAEGMRIARMGAATSISNQHQPFG